MECWRYTKDPEWEKAYLHNVVRYDEVLGLLGLADLLEFEYPYEIYEVAQVEQWRTMDDLGDYFLDISAMNDTLYRRHEKARVLWVGDYIGVCVW